MRGEGSYPTGRSSAITLPSFGSVPGATSFTAPLSLVTDCSVSAIASLEAGARRRRIRPAASSRPARPRASRRGARASSSGWRLRHLGDLLGAHEHALHLGGLVGAAHPALDARVGAPAGRGARPARRRGRRSQAGSSGSRGLNVVTTTSPTSPSGDRIAGAGPHDLEDHVLVDDHAFAARRSRRR